MDKPPLKQGVPDATAFVMPDLPDSWNKRSTYDGRAFSIRPSIVALFDYTAFTQDDASLKQVGEQKDQWDLRTFRLMSAGKLKFSHPVQYFVSVEVKGHDHQQSGDSKVGFTDWYVSTQVGKLGDIRYGKIKEPYIYEIVGDSANLQQQERILSPFLLPTRNIGVKVSNVFAQDRMTWAAGWFNDWWTTDHPWKASGNQFAARVTGLAFTSDEDANYLHLGASARYLGADDGTLRFRQRPESNIASYYVDTGDLSADYANEMGIELVSGHGPFFLTSEYARTWVHSSDTGSPRLWAGYVAVSYVLTGEHRPYDRKVAYARRVMPSGKWGAWEIFGRFSRVDGDDQQVQGGVLDKVAAGVNWWATRRWKIGVDYGVVNLDRFGITGTTHAIHTRIQWLY